MTLDQQQQQQQIIILSASCSSGKICVLLQTSCESTSSSTRTSDQMKRMKKRKKRRKKMKRMLVHQEEEEDEAAATAIRKADEEIEKSVFSMIKMKKQQQQQPQLKQTREIKRDDYCCLSFKISLLLTFMFLICSSAAAQATSTAQTSINDHRNQHDHHQRAQPPLWLPDHDRQVGYHSSATSLLEEPNSNNEKLLVAGWLDQKPVPPAAAAAADAARTNNLQLPSSILSSSNSEKQPQETGRLPLIRHNSLAPPPSHNCLRREKRTSSSSSFSSSSSTNNMMKQQQVNIVRGLLGHTLTIPCANLTVAPASTSTAGSHRNQQQRLRSTNAAAAGSGGGGGNMTQSQPLTAATGGKSSSAHKVALIVWHKDDQLDSPIYSVDARRASSLRDAKEAAGVDSTLVNGRAHFEYTEEGPLAPRVSLVILDASVEDAGVYTCTLEFNKAPTQTHVTSVQLITPAKNMIIRDESTDQQLAPGLIGPYDEDSHLTLTCQVEQQLQQQETDQAGKLQIGWYQLQSVLPITTTTTTTAFAQSRTSITAAVAATPLRGQQTNFSLPEASSSLAALDLLTTQSIPVESSSLLVAQQMSPGHSVSALSAAAASAGAAGGGISKEFFVGFHSSNSLAGAIGGHVVVENYNSQKSAPVSPSSSSLTLPFVTEPSTLASLKRWRRVQDQMIVNNAGLVGPPPPSSAIGSGSGELASPRKVLQATIQLTLTRASLADEYLCLANNNDFHPPLNSSVKINLNLKPREIRIVNKQNYAFRLGQKVSIECQVLGSKPPAKITWLRGSQQINVSSTLGVDDAGGGPIIRSNINGDAVHQLSDEHNNNNSNNNYISEFNSDTIIPSNNNNKQQQNNYHRNHSSYTTKQVSYLTLIPQLSDNQQSLTCTAHNPSIIHSSSSSSSSHPPSSSAIISDSIIMNVLFPPKLSLQFGASIKLESIRLGSDIFFECLIQANPPVDDNNLIWLFNELPLQTNVSAGVIISNQSLVLQRIRIEQRGSYQCLARNSMGEARSNKLELKPKFAPVCDHKLTRSRYEVALNQPVKIECAVLAEPEEDLKFVWYFNQTSSSGGSETSRMRSLSSGEELEAPVSSGSGRLELVKQFETNFTQSYLIFTPQSRRDFGQFLCSASNAMQPAGNGAGMEPLERACVISVLPSEAPLPVFGCFFDGFTNSSFAVHCQAAPSEQSGSMSGGRQTYLLELYKPTTTAATSGGGHGESVLRSSSSSAEGLQSTTEEADDNNNNNNNNKKAAGRKQRLQQALAADDHNEAHGSENARENRGGDEEHAASGDEADEDNNNNHSPDGGEETNSPDEDNNKAAASEAQPHHHQQQQQDRRSHLVRAGAQRKVKFLSSFTSDTPTFQLTDLRPATSYTVMIYARNGRGRSAPVTHHPSTLSSGASNEQIEQQEPPEGASSPSSLSTTNGKQAWPAAQESSSGGGSSSRVSGNEIEFFSPTSSANNNNKQQQRIKQQQDSSSSGLANKLVSYLSLADFFSSASGSSSAAASSSSNNNSDGNDVLAASKAKDTTAAGANRKPLVVGVVLIMMLSALSIILVSFLVSRFCSPTNRCRNNRNMGTNGRPSAPRANSNGSLTGGGANQMQQQQQAVSALASAAANEAAKGASERRQKCRDGGGVKKNWRLRNSRTKTTTTATTAKAGTATKTAPVGGATVSHDTTTRDNKLLIYGQKRVVHPTTTTTNNKLLPSSQLSSIINNNNNGGGCGDSTVFCSPPGSVQLTSLPTISGTLVVTPSSRSRGTVGSGSDTSRETANTTTTSGDSTNTRLNSSASLLHNNNKSNVSAATALAYHTLDAKHLQKQHLDRKNSKNFYVTTSSNQHQQPRHINFFHNDNDKNCDGASPSPVVVGQGMMVNSSPGFGSLNNRHSNNRMIYSQKLMPITQQQQSCQLMEQLEQTRNLTPAQASIVSGISDCTSNENDIPTIDLVTAEYLASQEQQQQQQLLIKCGSSSTNEAPLSGHDILSEPVYLISGRNQQQHHLNNNILSTPLLSGETLSLLNPSSMKTLWTYGEQAPPQAANSRQQHGEQQQMGSLGGGGGSLSTGGTQMSVTSSETTGDSCFQQTTPTISSRAGQAGALNFTYPDTNYNANDNHHHHQHYQASCLPGNFISNSMSIPVSLSDCCVHHSSINNQQQQHEPLQVHQKHPSHLTSVTRRMSQDNLFTNNFCHIDDNCLHPNEAMTSYITLTPENHIHHQLEPLEYPGAAYSIDHESDVGNLPLHQQYNQPQSIVRLPSDSSNHHDHQQHEDDDETTTCSAKGAGGIDVDLHHDYHTQTLNDSHKQRRRCNAVTFNNADTLLGDQQHNYHQNRSHQYNQITPPTNYQQGNQGQQVLTSTAAQADLRCHVKFNQESSSDCDNTSVNQYKK